MITHTKSKVPTDVRRARNLAHDRASEMWGESRKLSPIGGLAELVRGNDMPIPLHVKMANRAAFQRRNAESVAQNTRRVEYKVKGSDRYFPHQGPREIARRVRQMDYGILKHRGYREEVVTVECSAIPGQGGATSDIEINIDPAPLTTGGVVDMLVDVLGADRKHEEQLAKRRERDRARRAAKAKTDEG